MKQKTQHQIELPGDTWQDLQDYVINRDPNYTVSSEYACAGSSNLNNQSEFQALKNQLTESTKLLKEKTVFATYVHIQPRNRQNDARFCTYCKRSGHTFAYCFEKKGMTSTTDNPLVIGTKLLITTDALDQVNTKDRTFTKKVLRAEPEIFSQVIRKNILQ